MSGDINERLTQFLKSLKLNDIKPMSLHSDRLGDMPAPNTEINLEWKQAFADGDPVAVNAETRAFRPRYEITVSFQGAPIFQQVSVFSSLLSSSSMLQSSTNSGPMKKSGRFSWRTRFRRLCGLSFGSLFTMV